MLVEYFVIFGVLFAGYAVFRIFVWDEMDFRPLPREKVDDSPGKPIDAAQLSDRVRDLRGNLQTRPKRQTLSFKQSLLIESRREKVAQSDYFRRPPPPEKPEEEHPGLTAILI